MAAPAQDIVCAVAIEIRVSCARKVLNREDHFEVAGIGLVIYYVMHQMRA
jgi:hypothetical protein